MKKLLTLIILLFSSTVYSGIVYYKGVGFSDTSVTYSTYVYSVISPNDKVAIGRITLLKEYGTSTVTNSANTGLDVWFKVNFSNYYYFNNTWTYKDNVTISYYSGNKSDWDTYIDPLLNNQSGVPAAASLLDTYKIDDLVTFTYSNPGSEVGKYYKESGYPVKYTLKTGDGGKLSTNNPVFDTDFIQNYDHYFYLGYMDNTNNNHWVQYPNIRFKINANAIPEPSVLWLLLVGLPLLTIKTKRN